MIIFAFILFVILFVLTLLFIIKDLFKKQVPTSQYMIDQREYEMWEINKKYLNNKQNKNVSTNKKS